MRLCCAPATPRIWSTDLSQAAVCLTNAKLRLPARAVVIGTESTGCSPTMLSAADRRIYMPLHGFADSLNLSVAAALLLQRLQDIDDTVVGDMSGGFRKDVYSPVLPRHSSVYVAMSRAAQYKWFDHFIVRSGIAQRAVHPGEYCEKDCASRRDGKTWRAAPSGTCGTVTSL